ncbi:hypothetical protein [Neorhodopirellula lusitana]|uniref:hypothetical protein n=1 Tax=Neorhodopirellula lusitana TaxID=445327 RepID=UPI00384AE30D
MKSIFMTVSGNLFGLAVCAVALVPVVPASADWLTLPSDYTHDAISGQRVAQYAPATLPTAPQGPPVRTSGYTHYRSTLAYGQSADNYHRVEEWGDPVRPYGEWRFPYRPYSTPYPNWGAPFAGLNLNNGVYFGGQTGVVPTVLPGGGRNGYGQNGIGQAGGNPSGRNQSSRRSGPNRHGFSNPAAGTNGLAPYPSGQGTPYPVAPYYDGYYPNYRD